MADLSDARQIEAQRTATANRRILDGGCGCFHCLSLFRADQVTAWTDEGETALCPRCGMDAVVPADALHLGAPELAEMKRRWFKPPYEDATA